MCGTCCRSPDPKYLALLQEKLKLQFEEEQQRQKEKEEKARMENERLKREAEEKRLAIIRANEEREKKAQERTEREQREMAKEETTRQDEAHHREDEEAAARRVVQAAQRPKSPPIPTLRQGGSGAAQDSSPSGGGVRRSPPPAQRARYSPPPAPTSHDPPAQGSRSNERAAGERPSSHTGSRPSSRSQATKVPPRARQEQPPQSYEPKPKSTHDVMQQLSQLRERLAREQKKSDHQLQRGQEQFQNLQANAQQRQLKGKADVFERIRRQASVRNPSTARRDEPRSAGGDSDDRRADDGAQASSALEAFNKLKYGGGLGDGRAKDQFVQVRCGPLWPAVARCGGNKKITYLKPLHAGDHALVYLSCSPTLPHPSFFSLRCFPRRPLTRANLRCNSVRCLISRRASCNSCDCSWSKAAARLSITPPRLPWKARPIPQQALMWMPLRQETKSGGLRGGELRV